MLRLFLVRHGITEWNQNGLYQGRRDVPLSDEGRRQSALLGARLRGQRFACCYTSGLARAQESAAIILGANRCPVHQAGDLDEMSYGRWEGLTRAQVQDRFPEDWALFMQDRLTHAPGGGESVADLHRRLRRFRLALAREQSDAEAAVLVVAHGGSLRALVADYLELSPGHARRLRLDNVSLCIVEVYAGDAILSLFNDTSHLGPGKEAPERRPVH